MANNTDLGKNAFVTNVMPVLGSLYSNNILAFNTARNTNGYECIHDSILEEDVLKCFFDLNPSNYKPFNEALRRSISTQFAMSPDNIFRSAKWSMDLLFLNKNHPSLFAKSNFRMIETFYDLFQDIGEGTSLDIGWWTNGHNKTFKLGHLYPDDYATLELLSSLPISFFTALNCTSILNHNFNHFREVSYRIKLLAFSPSANEMFVHDLTLNPFANNGNAINIDDRKDIFNSQYSDSGISSITYRTSTGETKKNGGSTIASWNNPSVPLHSDAKVIGLSVIFDHSPETSMATMVNTNMNIGSIGLGSYYVMPTAADIGFSKSIEFDGIEREETITGRSLYNVKNITPGFLLKYEPITGHINFNSSASDKAKARRGRRMYELEFQGIMSQDVFPLSETGEYDIPTDYTLSEKFSSFANVDNNSNSSNQLTLFHALVHDTIGGQIPFIFIENVDDLNEHRTIRQDNMTQCILDSKSIDVESVAPDFYSVGLSLREVW